jgi:hypothetical protein
MTGGMALFEVKDNQTGKVYEFEGNAPPSQEQLATLIDPPPDVVQASQVLGSQAKANPEKIETGNQYSPQEQAIYDLHKKINQKNSTPSNTLPSPQNLGR